MRILMLSWEFPPRNVGGIAQHVYDLSSALTELGEEVHVVTCGDGKTKDKEIMNGVNVYRLNPYKLSAPDFLKWIFQLNFAMIETAIPVLNSLDDFDIVHAHDWVVAYAGRVLKYAYRLPLLATIHATEYGRNQGLHNELQRSISDVEWWLTYEAWKVIVCSHYMKNELRSFFQVPEDKINIIPNGVDLHRYVNKELKSFQREIYAADDEKIIFFVGRLVQEKGVQLLLDAVPKIIHYYPKAKVVIAGKGPMEESLKEKARFMGIFERVYFTGYIDDDTRDSLYREAAAAVFPSLYEPFGMVVLEAMAAKTPVIVSDVGGLGEIVEHEHNGLKCYAGSADSLADNILRILHQPKFASKMASQAYKDLHKFYTWKEIAVKTREVYDKIIEDYAESDWKSESWLEKIDPAFLEVGSYGYPEEFLSKRELHTVRR